ncbi:hypothetical protein [Streptomyces sp. MMG1121]|uniref:hypothetical protein n=1 Tax=Streptomyces sp. MMG1121 TaxID=1415544 RepID=UPI0006AFC4C2|nr:hypothetical protein [Streptomyces sp. MMG1121]KOV60563.1 hypothetical protein ADK64_30910 [Streptomyces sp. MMG1121]
MSGLGIPRARHAVRRSARQGAANAPMPSAGSASALRAGLAARTAGLRRAARAAWPAGRPST